MRNKRGQHLFEWVTTYAWSILILLVVLGGLAYMGILDPRNMLASSCATAPDLACVDIAARVEGIEVVLQNGHSTPVNILDIEITGCTGPTYPLSALLEDEQRTFVVSNCDYDLEGIREINITKLPRGGLPKTVKGEIRFRPKPDEGNVQHSRVLGPQIDCSNPHYLYNSTPAGSYPYDYFGRVMVPLDPAQFNIVDQVWFFEFRDIGGVPTAVPGLAVIIENIGATTYVGEFAVEANGDQSLLNQDTESCDLDGVVNSGPITLAAGEKMNVTLWQYPPGPAITTFVYTPLQFN